MTFIDVNRCFHSCNDDCDYHCDIPEYEVVCLNTKYVMLVYYCDGNIYIIDVANNLYFINVKDMNHEDTNNKIEEIKRLCV